MHIPADLIGYKGKAYYRDQRAPTDLLTPFVDELFPPEEKSITQIDKTNLSTSDVSEEELSDIRGLEWKRPGDIYKTFKLFNDINAEDIKQGMLGNCYFLSSISATAEFKDRILNLFVNKATADNGCYSIRFMIQGVPKIILVDDFLPCKKGTKQLAFNRLKDEIWVQLLEKAWAKVNGSYASTIAGLPSEALSTLTEAPCLTYIHVKFEPEKLWDIIFSADKNDYIICTSSNSKPNLDKNGIVSSHAYTIINVYKVQNLQLLKIRNPWGGFEWNGAYSDKSNLWTDDLKNAINYEDKDDGIFYMEFGDFLKFFPYTFICRYENNYYYDYKKFYQYPHESMIFAKIVIEQPTKIIIGLHQRQQRFNRKIPNYVPQMSRIILCKYDKTKFPCYRYIKSHASTNEKLHLDIPSLAPGEYHIITHVNWPYDHIEKNSYVISTYSERLVQVQSVSKEDIPDDFMHEIVYSFLEKKTEKKLLKKGLEFYSSLADNDLGFYLILFKNVDEKSVHNIKFKASYNKNVRLMTEHPHQTSCSEGTDWINDEIVASIEPHSDYLVMFELLDQPWNSKIKISSITFYSQKPQLNKDPIRDQIDEQMSRFTKKELNPDCVYCEFRYESSIFFIVKNKSRQESYKFRINLIKLENLRVVTANPISFIIHSDTYEYIEMRINDKKQAFDYDFEYSFKRL